MSDAAIAIAEPNALERWLKFDPSRVDKVEAAYQDYVRHGRPGVWAILAIVLGVIVAIAAYVFVNDPANPAQGRLITTLATIVTIYAALLVPFLLTPASSRRLLLAGCCEPRRAFIFAVAGSFAVAILEYGTLVTLTLLHVKYVPAAYDMLTGGLAFATFLTVIWAPVAEELLVQGWFQTRMLRFGPAWAGVLATIFFVLIHLPKNPYEFVRCGGLAFVAYLRATTRSLGACMVAHATNNLLFFGIYVLYRFTHHTVH